MSPLRLLLPCVYILVAMPRLFISPAFYCSMRFRLARSLCSSLLAQSQLAPPLYPGRRSDSTLLMSPPTSTDEVPLLLLEGDEFYVSHDGICRTYYELRQDTLITTGTPALTLEEEYDLNTARKVFTLQSKPQHEAEHSSKISLISKHAQGVLHRGRPVSPPITLQEIDHGVFGRAGTGSTTWEASLAMALLVSASPNLLKGSVLELGSGVGLGGLLIKKMIPGLDLTLSDGNDEVLKACRRNLEANQASSIHLYKLDWHCLPKKRQKYDTILASDCAYKYTDIQSLAVTMKAFLKPTGKIHILAPHNRGALQQLLLELRDGQSMSVVIRGLELNRYRLKSHGEDIEEEEEALFCSQQVAKFLHITASHSIKTSQQEGKHESIDDID